MWFLIYIRSINFTEAIQQLLIIYGVNIMSNINKIKETASTAEDMARKIWLAGLGAYGEGFEEVKGRIESLSTDSSKFFDELAAKGEKLETEGKDKIKQVKSDVVAKADIDSRIETVRTKLGFTKTDNGNKVEELSSKIDALAAAVAKLAKPTDKKS
jgi:outer membrane murein-binding lipoprotein Lpp